MKITSLSPTPAANSAASRSESTRQNVPKPAEHKPVAPEVQSSGMAEALSEASDVDMSKVNEIRQAIREGQLSLDPEVLAEAVLSMHRR